MKTLIPTTVNVNESITINEAVKIFKEKTDVTYYDIESTNVEGSYVADSGEIVTEKSLIVNTRESIASKVCKAFTQETVLEYDNNGARLINAEGEVVVNFNAKELYRCDNLSDAIELQNQLTIKYGGASRVGNTVWAFKNVKNTNKEKRKQFKELAESRLGESKLNQYGTKMHIVKYHNSDKIEVFFPEHGATVTSTYHHFTKGKIVSPYDKTAYSIGCLGEGEYNNTKSEAYVTWCNILKRSYSNSYQTVQPTYKGTSVSEEWLNFQNFAKWFNENYYTVEGVNVQIEKDLLVKGNKVYSAETCVFVPQEVNIFFSSAKSKESTLPTGISMVNGKYLVQVGMGKVGNKPKVSKCTFESLDDAKDFYVKCKQERAIQLADKYKDVLDKRVVAKLNSYNPYFN